MHKIKFLKLKNFETNAIIKCKAKICNLCKHPSKSSWTMSKEEGMCHAGLMDEGWNTLHEPCLLLYS